MSTINGFVVELTTQPSNTEVSFRLLGSAPVVLSTSIIRTATKRVRTDVTGFFSIVLSMGDYEMTVEGIKFTISVPNDSNTYNFVSRIVSSAVYSPTVPAGVAAPNASALVLGLVKTNATAGTPVVYLKSEVDTLLGAIGGGGGSFTVDTVTLMRAIASSVANKVCECFGLSAVDDGMGGRYRWASGAAPADDAITNIRPTDYSSGSPIGYWHKFI